MAIKERFDVIASSLSSYFGVGFNTVQEQLDYDLGKEENIVDDEAQDRMNLGIAMEDGCLNYFETKMGILIDERNSEYKYACGGKLKCKRDGRTFLDGVETGWENKYSNSSSGPFTEDLGYEIQCQAYMMAWGLDQWVLAGMWCGKPYYKLIKANPEIQADIEAIVDAVVEIEMGLREVDEYPWDIVAKYSKQVKLKELNEYTKVEDICEDIAHYEMLARQQLNQSGYSVVHRNKDPQTHHNWKYFEYLRELCLLKRWDTKLYIEMQFKRFTEYESRFKIPYPNMLCSDAAISYFIKQIGAIQQTYKKDIGGKKKERGKQTLDLKSEIHNEVLRSIKNLHWYIESNKMIEDSAQYKTIKIFQSWEEFSPYYLWSIPWFKDVLNDVEGRKKEECIKLFEQINKSKSIQDIIKTEVKSLEDKYHIPPNLQLF